MKRPMMIYVLVLGGLLGRADTRQKAAAIFEQVKAKQGLCLHIGSKDELTAHLAAHGDFLVHGLSFSDADATRARAGVTRMGLNGQVSVALTRAGALPYVPNLANVIVVEDPLILKRFGVDELMYILAPGGELVAWDGERWQLSTKPWPKTMDDWTHPQHGPDGNMVSTDRELHFPLGIRWIGGLPKNINRWASVRGWVLANGRCFAVTGNEAANLSRGKEKQHYLIARDAFNGLPLWKANLETSDDGAALFYQNAAPLVADDHQAYAVQRAQPVAFDASTGAVNHRFDTQYQPARLLLLNNTLVAACWAGRDSTKASFERKSLWTTWVNSTDKGTVEAFDASTGKQKWQQELAAHKILAAGNTVYVATRVGNPASENDIIALDLETGKERWRVAHTELGETMDLEINLAATDFVSVLRRQSRGITFLRASDGEMLWEIPGRAIEAKQKETPYLWTSLVNGELWYGNRKYDPLSGEVKGMLPMGLPTQGCTPSILVGNILTRSRRCEYTEFPLSADPLEKAKTIKFEAARGGCMEGMVPANGMFYTSQNNCQCAPGQVLGFLGFGPDTRLPTAGDWTAKRPHWGLGPPSGTPVSAGGWTTYRGNSSRSRSTVEAAPSGLKKHWVFKPRAIKSGYRKDWDARLAPALTQPIVSGEHVVVGEQDSGRLLAVDTRTGKLAWEYALPSRMDSSPTIDQGLVLAGCHDGWLYALALSSGDLVWRTRIAPLDQYIVANGRVESSWPVAGSPLIVHDRIYAVAGRSTEADGGLAVVELSRVGGLFNWGTSIEPGPRRRLDLLYEESGKIFVNNTRIDPVSKKAVTDPKALKARPAAGSAILDAYLGLHKMRGFSQDLDAWTAELFVRANQASLSAGEPGASLPKSGPLRNPRWRINLERGSLINALAITPGHVLVAAMTGDGSGRVLLIEKGKGQQVARIDLAVMPVYDGLSVSGGRVFVACENGELVCLGKGE